MNPDLTSLYFTALFIGAKNSGKTYGLVKSIKNYESSPIQDADGNILQIRTILLWYHYLILLFLIHLMLT